MNMTRGGDALMTLSLNKTVETFPRHFVIDSLASLTRPGRLSEHCNIDLWMKRADLGGPTKF